MTQKEELTQLIEEAIAERISASVLAEEILDHGFVRKEDLEFGEIEIEKLLCEKFVSITMLGNPELNAFEELAKAFNEYKDRIIKVKEGI